jgi:hypothetical protein
MQLMESIYFKEVEGDDDTDGESSGTNSGSDDVTS